MTAEQSAPAPRVRIVTDLGDIVVELRPERAPRSAAAFLTEVRDGAYDGGRFGRVVREENDNARPLIEVIQAVCASSDDMRADVEVEETAATGLSHLDGTISLPRLDGGLSSAQSFFICVGAQPALDSGGGRTADGLGFAAFGRVIEGMDTVHAIHGLPTVAGGPSGPMKGQVPVNPPLIRAVRLDASAASTVPGAEGIADVPFS